MMTYSFLTRKKVNKYCYEEGLQIFGLWEYIKSFFPKMFPEDKIRTEFYKKFLFYRKLKDNSEIIPLENCVNNIFRTSKNLIADSGYNYNNKDKIHLDFKRNNPFAYEFLSLIRTKKDRDDIIDEFGRVSRIINIKGYAEADDIFELSKLIYKIIITFENNIDCLENILNSARNIGISYTTEKHKVRNDIELFKDSFSTLVRFYKKELRPIILKKIDFYNEENNNFDSEIYQIYDLLEMLPEDVFTYERYEQEQQRMRKLVSEIEQMKDQENNLVMEAFEESIQYINKIFPGSNISNIVDFEFILPYFIVKVIKDYDINLEPEELESVSRNDPMQIAISLFSIIWYEFLLLFNIENELDNSDLINELDLLKTRWQKYFKVFKRYFEVLLDYKKESTVPGKDSYERTLYEVRAHIFYISNVKKSEPSLSNVTDELLLFLNKIETSKTKFFIWYKNGKDKKLDQEESMEIFSKYKKLLEMFSYLLRDKSSFLLENIKTVTIATEEELDILRKYKLI